MNPTEFSIRCATTAVIALSLLGATACPVMADDRVANSLRSDASFEEHLQQQYRFADGLPSDWIHDILQTHDGYVWIATHNGVARYDGIRFQVFNRSNTPQLPANDTRVLYESRDGVLWIGTIGGLVRFQPGRPSKIDAIEQFAGNSVHAITEVRDGTVWIGTREETWRAKGSEFEIATDAPRNVRALCEDSEGRLWFGTMTGLYVLHFEFERISHPRLLASGNTNGSIRTATINALFADEDGGVWVGSNTGLLFI